MRTTRLVFSLSALLVILAVSTYAQRNIYLYTEPNFDGYGFTEKLTAALRESAIGSRIKTAVQPALEALNASNPGEIVAQIITSEFMCGGKRDYAISLVMYTVSRNKNNSLEKIYIGSSVSYIREQTIDSDVSQFKTIIVDALTGR